ncbi:threonine dehydratase [Blastomyces dermatitidis ER-3]|uniref:Threonine dehydratase n=1 Tax=Ajellomyces dermatitidis (strain ER-3 / ATCC MYA-2586) TaxID=559297 RepID=A0ABP2F0M2_AJEDR|nr:threonine dehydratase [Blastomyces dermatitidis ER-3]EEQ88583.1 threonine dehydratase [Blastomyces dermatitidis ER-3]
MGSYGEPIHEEFHSRSRVLDPKSQPKPWRETPLIESEPLSKLAGCRIFLKLENMQPGGSFKSRAMGNLILHHLSRPANQNKNLHFFIPSGGNAGIAAVTAARALGYPCTVVVPVYTKQMMLQRLQAAGAITVPHGDTIDAAATYMRNVLMGQMRGAIGDDGREVVAVELHPFDHEAAWEGVSSLVEELAAQMPPEDDGDAVGGGGRPFPVDGIVCSVGGGGLMNGIMLGIERELRRAEDRGVVDPSRGKDVHILALETRGAESLAKAVEKRSLVTLPAVSSQATSLAAIQVAERTLKNVLYPPEGMKAHSFVMDDADAARGVLRLVDEHRLLVELACGLCVEGIVPVATNQGVNGHANGGPVGGGALSSKLAQVIPGFGPESRVVVIVCGGSNITVEVAAEYRERLNNGWGSGSG